VIEFVPIIFVQGGSDGSGGKADYDSAVQQKCAAIKCKPSGVLDNSPKLLLLENTLGAGVGGDVCIEINENGTSCNLIWA
jgi:hypothetical protein